MKWWEKTNYSRGVRAAMRAAEPKPPGLPIDQVVGWFCVVVLVMVLFAVAVKAI